MARKNRVNDELKTQLASLESRREHMAAKDNGVLRVDLPGDAWWDIRVDGITWDEIKAVRTEIAKAQAKGLDVNLDETLLLHFTIATSEKVEGNSKEIFGVQIDALGSGDAKVAVLLMDAVSEYLFPLFPGVRGAAKSVLETFTNP